MDLIWRRYCGKQPLPSPDRATGVQLPSIQKLNSNVSEKTSQAVMQAMAMQADQRPQTIDDFLNLLVGSQPVITLRPTPSDIPSNSIPTDVQTQKKKLLGANIRCYSCGRMNSVRGDETAFSCQYCGSFIDATVQLFTARIIAGNSQPVINLRPTSSDIPSNSIPTDVQTQKKKLLGANILCYGCGRKNSVRGDETALSCQYCGNFIDATVQLFTARIIAGNLIKYHLADTAPDSFLNCPICNSQVKAKNVEHHMEKIHDVTVDSLLSSVDYNFESLDSIDNEQYEDDWTLIPPESKPDFQQQPNKLPPPMIPNWQGQLKEPGVQPVLPIHSNLPHPVRTRPQQDENEGIFGCLGYLFWFMLIGGIIWLIVALVGCSPDLYKKVPLQEDVSVVIQN